MNPANPMPNFKSDAELFLYKAEATHFHFRNKEARRNETQQDIADQYNVSIGYVNERIGLIESEIQAKLASCDKEYTQVRAEYAKQYTLNKFEDKFGIEAPDINEILGNGLLGIRDYLDEHR